eukprot:9289901-Pyramimonas_sp.AAC.1
MALSALPECNMVTSGHDAPIPLFLALLSRISAALSAILHSNVGHSPCRISAVLSHDSGWLDVCAGR